MNEDRSAKFGRRFKDRKHRRIIKVDAVDMGANLDSSQAKLLHATFHLLNRQPRQLHGNRAKACKALREGVTDLGDVIVEAHRQIKRIARELSLSPSTVSTYRTRILKKVRVTSNAELVHYAIRHKLIDE